MIYPGSFDPPTIGHLNLICRASALCDRLVVAVMTSGQKKAFLAYDQRKDLLELACRKLSVSCEIVVRTYPGLTADLYREEEAQAALRGIRNGEDLSYEFALAETNHQLNPQYETVFLPARPDLAYVSSTLVREMIRLGKDFDRWVPAGAREEFQTILTKSQSISDPARSEEKY